MMIMMMIKTLNDANVHNLVQCSCRMKAGNDIKVSSPAVIGQCWNKTTSCLTFIWLHTLVSKSAHASCVKRLKNKTKQKTDYEGLQSLNMSRLIQK